MVEVYSLGIVLGDGQIRDQHLSHGKGTFTNLQQIQTSMLTEQAMCLAKDLQKQPRQILTICLWMQTNG